MGFEKSAGIILDGPGGEENGAGLTHCTARRMNQRRMSV